MQSHKKRSRQESSSRPQLVAPHRSKFTLPESSVAVKEVDAEAAHNKPKTCCRNMSKSSKREGNNSQMSTVTKKTSSIRKKDMPRRMVVNVRIAPLR